MDIILLTQSILSFLLNPILTFLIGITILVFVHEFGHYIVARWCKVRVEIFSVGFGKEIFGWTDKNGTRWKIASIPLGGYVKMFGEGDAIIRDEDSQSEREMTEAERKKAMRMILLTASLGGLSFLSFNNGLILAYFSYLNKHDYRLRI